MVATVKSCTSLVNWRTWPMVLQITVPSRRALTITSNECFAGETKVQCWCSDVPHVYFTFFIHFLSFENLVNWKVFRGPRDLELTRFYCTWGATYKMCHLWAITYSSCFSHFVTQKCTVTFQGQSYFVPGQACSKQTRRMFNRSRCRTLWTLHVTFKWWTPGLRVWIEQPLHLQPRRNDVRGQQGFWC